MNESNYSPENAAGQGQPTGSVQPAQGNQRGGNQNTPGAAESAANEARKLKEVAREKGSAALEQVKTSAQSVAQQAQETGRTYITRQKETLAQKVDEYAKAARAAADRLKADEGNMLAEPTGRAAQQLERLSGYLREKQPIDLLDDLEGFTRRRPEVVFGGLFIAGLAATRFLKASRRRSRQDSIEPYRPSMTQPPSSWDYGHGSPGQDEYSAATDEPGSSEQRETFTPLTSTPPAP